MPTGIHSRDYRVLFISAALVVLVVAAFEPVRHNEFVRYDDPDYITANPHIQSGLTAQSVKWAFTSGYAANWHPLTWLSHMLDIELFGLSPLGHHLHNLGLHLAVTLVLFWVLRGMTGAPWRSAFVAMAFGLHPVHVESVVWGCERKDVLCAVFWMLTMAAYLSYVRRGGALRYTLVVLCFALGLMAKAMIVTLPVVLLILDFWPLRRLSRTRGDGPRAAAVGPRRGPTPLVRLILEKVPLFALTFAASVVTFLVQQKGGSVAGLDVSLTYRLSNTLVGYIRYLGKLAYPAHLAVIYPPPPHGWPLWAPLVCLLLLLVVSGFVLYYGRRRPYLLVGWAWYLVTLLPVIGLVQIGNQAIADRFTYLPSIGIFLLLAWGAAELLAPWRQGRIVLAALSVLLGLGMLAGTRAQVSCWKDSESLLRHALAVTRDNYLACHYLATFLDEHGQLAEAEKLYRESLRLHAGHAEAHLCLGQIFDARGEYTEALRSYEQAMQLDSTDWRAFYKAGAIQARQGLLAEAENLFRQSLRLNKDFAKGHLDLGQVLTAQKKYADALASYERAIQLDPADPKPLYYAGAVKMQQRAWNEATDYFRRSIHLDPNSVEAYFGLGVALRQQGKTEEAVAQFRSVLKIKPDNGAAWTHLVDCLLAQGKPQEAIESCRQALKLSPRDVALHYKLAQILKGQRRLPEAVSQHRSALEIKPDFVPSLNDLAWLLATARDDQVRNPAEAIQLAEKACTLTSSRDYNCLDTLAAAYARAQQFEKAVETVQKAIALAQAANQAKVVQDITEELQLYQAGQAYTEP